MAEKDPRSKNPVPVADLSYTDASRELDVIVAFFEGRDVDVDQLVARLERATAIVDELDRRLRRTRAQVEELVPRLAAAAALRPVDPESADGDDGDDGADGDHDAASRLGGDDIHVGGGGDEGERGDASRPDAAGPGDPGSTPGLF